MSKHLAGLIKLPCRATKAFEDCAPLYSSLGWCDILDDRGLRIASAAGPSIAAAIVVALNHPSAPTDFDYAPHEAT